MPKKKKVNDSFERIRRATPLRIRLYVHFTAEYMTMHYTSGKTLTEKQRRTAGVWGRKMAKSVLKKIVDWEKDGRPN